MSVAVRQALGRPFVSPLFDTLLIGGGLSLLACAFVLLEPEWAELVEARQLPYFILLSNSAHFGASTVRLYTKPGAFGSLPFVTMAFPLACLAVALAGILYPGNLGRHLQALYLTWSPYHYALQAYGLAVMYSYRSGCALSLDDKKLLRWVCLLPFLNVFLTSESDVGLSWLVPVRMDALPAVPGVLLGLRYTLLALTFFTPVWVALRVRRTAGRSLPLISLLAVLSNAIWFFVLLPKDAFVWATIFHGIQYLGIVIIFHVKDQVTRPDNRHGLWYHVLWFYAASLALGYALFQCLPLAFVFAGFGFVESMMVVAAVINIHHFVVDGFIWRLGRADSNRRIVGSLPEAA